MNCELILLERNHKENNFETGALGTTYVNPVVC